MYAAIQKYMPKGIRFTNPDGGLFIFAEFQRKGINTDDIFKDVVEKRAAPTCQEVRSLRTAKLSTLSALTIPTQRKNKSKKG